MAVDRKCEGPEVFAVDFVPLWITCGRKTTKSPNVLQLKFEKKLRKSRFLIQEEFDLRKGLKNTAFPPAKLALPKKPKKLQEFSLQSVGFRIFNSQTDNGPAIFFCLARDRLSGAK